MRNEPKYYLKSLGDAFRILDIIGNSLEPRGIAELSDVTGIGRSKMHRILDNLLSSRRLWKLAHCHHIRAALDQFLYFQPQLLDIDVQIL